MADSPVKLRILRHGADLFARNGYAATGVAELERAVGIGRGALYHHIGSKENLLYEISIRHVREMVEYGEGLLAEDRPAAEKFRMLARRLMRTIADNLPELTVFYMDFRGLSEPHAAELHAIRARFEAIWVAILEQGVEEQTLRPTRPIMTKGILGMFNFSYLWLRPTGGMSPEEIADEFCDMALSGLTLE